MKKSNKWLLPKGAPWRTLCGKWGSKVERDVCLESFQLLHEKSKFLKAFVRKDIRKEFSQLPAGENYIIVAIDHVVEKFDTRPIRFDHNLRDITACIEKLREQIYDAEYNRKERRVPRHMFTKWRERLQMLYELKRKFE